MEMELYANQVLHAPVARQPDDRRAHRPDRPGRPALRHVRGQRAAAGEAAPGHDPRRAARRAGRTGGPAASSSPRCRSSAGPRRSGRAGRPHPLLSDRRNIIVIVDEAHRSHYDDLDGYARHLRDALPHATMIAFTGTPISGADRNTRERVRRLHRRLRPDPGRRRRRDRPGLLREPADPARTCPGRGPGA